MIKARAVFGWRSAKSRVQANTFSGWLGHTSEVSATVVPLPSLCASAFHGSPTQ